jgi:hypothetical protein
VVNRKHMFAIWYTNGDVLYQLNAFLHTSSVITLFWWAFSIAVEMIMYYKLLCIALLFLPSHIQKTMYFLLIIFSCLIYVIFLVMRLKYWPLEYDRFEVFTTVLICPYSGIWRHIDSSVYELTFLMNLLAALKVDTASYIWKLVLLFEFTLCHVGRDRKYLLLKTGVGSLEVDWATRWQTEKSTFISQWSRGFFYVPECRGLLRDQISVLPVGTLSSKVQT